MATPDELRPVEWADGAVRLIDQTRLPHAFVVKEYRDYREVAEAIRTMEVRGAPAIGAAAALGIALAALEGADLAPEAFRAHMDEAARVLASTRPTAVNLFWGINRTMAAVAAAGAGSPAEAAKRAVEEACAILEEDITVNRAMGRHGAALIRDGDTVLTHCNAGALATVGYGTALGVIRAAVEQGKRIRVFADETRPRLQGMKLSAWELAREGIDVTIISDNMAPALMRRGLIQCAVVGADRVAANGDVVNKIGTYGVALACRAHGIPFYVAAPLSTVDLQMPSGDEVPIEERASEEVTHVDGVRIAPEGVPVLNPAFDVTPAELVSALITEVGVLRAPYEAALREAVAGAARPGEER
ncbi:MAG TPA: S-methyl-5-thioribose-1-phosphate isomerase [Armatimonadota bacterium]|nr:S-methyl-5-thioribose-1-phosphate isomerase [Armatimonadota bacterium]